MKMMPTELSVGEDWQEDVEVNPISSGTSTFDPGMFHGLTATVRIFSQEFDPKDKEQLSKLRSMLGIGVQLCRERFKQQKVPRSVAVKCWLVTCEQLNFVLRLLSQIDNRPPTVGTEFASESPSD
jgi:hypothetical protein